MNYTSCLLCLLLLVWKPSLSQERYREQIADSVVMDTYSYAEKDEQVLDLDLYQPAFDGAYDRPVLVYIHGGGFAGGARNEAYIVDFCRQMAACGYVVASVDYRLTRAGKDTGFGCECPAEEKLNSFQSAVEDVQDATYFLIERWEQFAIDPHQIILAGSSAGAETALNTAFQPPYCYGLDSGPVSYAGVISMAGAIPDTSLIYNDSAVPALLFHGTDDELVPYATAPHHFCDETAPGYLLLDGSQTIAERLQQLDKPYWFFTLCGVDHQVYRSAMTDYRDEIIQFCYDYVLKGSAEQRNTVVEQQQSTHKFAFNRCNSDDDDTRE
ncbi:alpha/beta hydrolase [Mangrovibacterium marinum]|uniref:Acetyl esterase/lipase n=1 Tax=Mangrovibacterium marinum TaxID=1639118 RepID=A0A2T5C5A3_9BACT|nr:alpha/beta hydrolase [Mangrovibacterium marinum]PTN10069.1 acetyl esterase/lipase [Mangrovibacterium marinum]